MWPFHAHETPKGYGKIDYTTFGILAIISGYFVVLSSWFRLNTWIFPFLSRWIWARSPSYLYSHVKAASSNLFNTSCIPFVGCANIGLRGTPNNSNNKYSIIWRPLRLIWKGITWGNHRYCPEQNQTKHKLHVTWHQQNGIRIEKMKNEQKKYLKEFNFWVDIFLSFQYELTDILLLYGFGYRIHKLGCKQKQCTIFVQL